MSSVLPWKVGSFGLKSQCFTAKKGVHFGLKSQCFIAKKGLFWAEKSVFCCKKGGHFQNGEHGWVPFFPVSEGAATWLCYMTSGWGPWWPHRSTVLLLPWSPSTYFQLSCHLLESHTPTPIPHFRLGGIKRIHTSTVFPPALNPLAHFRFFFGTAYWWTELRQFYIVASLSEHPHTHSSTVLPPAWAPLPPPGWVALLENTQVSSVASRLEFPPPFHLSGIAR